MSVKESAVLRGHFVLRTIDGDTGLVVAEREADNILCAAGLTVLVQALNWAAIEDQNVNMGSPFVPTYLAPLYCAIGTGVTAVADTDVALTAEYARTVAEDASTQGASHLNDATVAWAFLFGFPAVAQVITEVGLFAQALNVPGTGSMLDHALIAGLPWAINQLLTALVTFSIGNI